MPEYWPETSALVAKDGVSPGAGEFGKAAISVLRHKSFKHLGVDCLGIIRHRRPAPVCSNPLVVCCIAAYQFQLEVDDH